MTEVGSLEKRLSELDTSPNFLLETVVLDVTERICEVMKREGITRAELAKRIGKSPAYVTKFLNGQPNMTLKTLVGIAVALGKGIDVFVPSSIREERKRAEIRHGLRHQIEYRYSLVGRSSKDASACSNVIVAARTATMHIAPDAERTAVLGEGADTGDQHGTDSALPIAA